MNRLSKIVLPVAILAVATGLTLVLVRTRPRVEPRPREAVLPAVRVVEARRAPHRFRVAAQGTVAPRTEIQLGVEAAGRVVRVSPSLAAGGFFAAGEVLVEVDPRDAEVALARARAALAETQVRLDREIAEAALARAEWEALGEGRPANPLVLREPQLAEARARVDAATADLRQAGLDLERCRLVAPFDGRIRSKLVDVGQVVARGQVVGSAYAVDHAEVRLPLALDQLGFADLPMGYRGGPGAAPGPEVTLRARIGGRDWEWSGTIHRTEGEVDARTRMITAVARVEDPYGRGGGDRPPLAVGLFVEAAIGGRTVDAAFRLAAAALRGDDRVLVVEPPGVLRIRPVTLLRREGAEVILGDGLRDGEQVCVSPLDAPVDGMRVRAVGPEDGAPGGSAP